MQVTALVGFLMLLAGWFAMFLRIRDDPGVSAGTYSSYVGPRAFGFRWARRNGLGLLKVYWRHYGLDARLGLAVAGLLLIVVAAFLGRG
jgi:hypothetical protein